MATLEELENADLLIHVIDISNPRHPDQIRSVETILDELKLSSIPTIRVLNKIDQLSPAVVSGLVQRHRGIPVSAIDRSTFKPLVEAMQTAVDHQ